MYNVTRFYTLISPAGAFEFTRETPISHAKLIRDTVTAAVHGTNGCTDPRRSNNEMMWLRSNMEGSVNKTPFRWYPAR